MARTFTLLTTDNNTDELNKALQRIASASSCVLGTSHVSGNKEQPYEVCRAESSLSVEAGKIASVAEDTLFSCSCK
ncbi:reticulate body protein Rbp-7 [Chlamydia vaughanii]|uniref:reticulate body protein Rbp-7 n=1 Tax=Chlamydia vaughanii TaxID=3112552 RepID=UPI0032B13C31